MLVGGINYAAVERPLWQLVVLEMVGNPVRIRIETDRDNAVDGCDPVGKPIEEGGRHDWRVSWLS